MRKIYSQTIDSKANQTALDNLANSLGIAKSRVMEKLIASIETEDLVAIVNNQLSLKSTKIVNLDRVTTQVIQEEIARSLSLLSIRVTDAANDGAKAGVICSFSNILTMEDPA
ncbi:hypothetical protein N1078_18405 [Pseudomonas sp. MIL19]|uniref:hypothetical protein n=1 Tax=Pseudomonas sp. MIL19 TaxID=2976979 RepID=UPI002363D1D8|nr:hypothetical protein [Pseudomonas sp. MIL19]MDD2162535.1 hypothetical protein [Pseudomonas sp. MIL19]